MTNLPEKIGASPFAQNQKIKGLESIKNIRQIPQDDLCEKMVLGYILITAKVPNETLPLLDSLFYQPKHQDLCNIILSIAAEGKLVNIVAVNLAIKAKNNALQSDLGIIYCVELTQQIISEKDYTTCFMHLHELRLRREAIKFFSEKSIQAFDLGEDILETVEASKIELSKITDFRPSKFTHAADVGKTMLLAWEQAEQGNYFVKNGIDISFFAPFKEYFAGGLPLDRYTLIAARPGMGKTNLMVFLTALFAKYFPVGIVCLESSTAAEIEKDEHGEIEQINLGNINYRFWANLSGVPYTQIKQAFTEGAEKNKKITEIVSLATNEKIKNGAKELAKLPIVMEDSAFELHEITQKITKMVLEHGIKVVFIDYIQLIEAGKNGGDLREQQVAKISRRLTKLQKDLGIHIVVLGQLNRSVETRGGDKKPLLSDLRESGALEQDAGKVIFVYRPEYYGILEDGAGVSLKDKTILIYAKNNEGLLGEQFFDHNLGTVQYFDPSMPLATLHDGRLQTIERVTISYEHNGAKDFDVEPMSKEEKDSLPF